MIYFIWSSAVLFAADLFLLFFFYLKGLLIQKKVAELLVIPLCCAFLLSLQLLKFPDSLHVISFLASTSLLSELCLIFMNKLNNEGKLSKKVILAFARVFALFTVFIWTRLFYTSLNLVRLPSWFGWLFTIAFILFFVVFAFIQHGESIFFYAYFALVFWACGYLIFTSLAEIGYLIKLHSVIGFFGGILFLFSVIQNLSKSQKTEKEHSEFISKTSFIFSQIIVSTAATIMICG